MKYWAMIAATHWYTWYQEDTGTWKLHIHLPDKAFCFWPGRYWIMSWYYIEAECSTLAKAEYAVREALEAEYGGDWTLIPRRTCHELSTRYIEYSLPEENNRG